MLLPKKTYKASDAIRFVVQASPGYAFLHMLLITVHALMPTAAMALATAHFVDTAIAILQGGDPQGDIFLPLLLLLLVLGTHTTIAAVIQLLNARIRLDLQCVLKPAVVQNHAALDYQHIENEESWELISRISRDPTKSVTDGYTAFMSFLQIVISVSSVLLLILTQVWWAAWIILAFSLPMFWLSIRAGQKNYQAGRDAETFHRRTAYLDEVLTGRDNVDERTLFAYGDAVGAKWRELYEAGRMLKFHVTLRTYLLMKGSSMTLSLIALMVALTLIRPVITGQMSAGMFMGIVGAVFGMINQLGWQMTESLESISRVSEWMKDLTAFLQLSEATDALVQPDSEAMPFYTLEFRNVRFRYPSSDRFLFDGLSFSLETGKHYAFVGENGAGKTTLTKLLTGLYPDYEGDIFINGKELRTYRAGAIKALFSVVYQDYSRYYIPLRDNIGLGNIAKRPGLEAIALSAKRAGLDETIAELDNGLATPLGKIQEQGQDLSGGQWQRVAIARSLISSAPVTILDEPTAALDPISESRIYSEFEGLMRGRTTLFISHRLGSTKLADEILVMSDGQIVERGSHDELVAIHGQYAAMYEAQREWYQ